MKSLRNGVSPVVSLRVPQDVLDKINHLVGPRQRSRFIQQAIESALKAECNCYAQGPRR